MSYGSMMGSGIYSEEIEVEIVCAEICGSCEDDQKNCKAVFNASLMTDDWGNIDQQVNCPQCNHSLRYRQERD